MTELEAIKARHSVRQYLDKPIEAEKIEAIQVYIDRPEVRVMVNPGGQNEKFAREHLTHATIIVHPNNEEIPGLVVQGEADAMITEITEAPWYVQNDPRLAAPLMATPFTHSEIGVLMRKGQDISYGIFDVFRRRVQQ